MEVVRGWGELSSLKRVELQNKKTFLTSWMIKHLFLGDAVESAAVTKGLHSLRMVMHRTSDSLNGQNVCFKNKRYKTLHGVEGQWFV